MRGSDYAERSRLLICVLLAVGCVVAGRLELFFAVPPGYATPIFLPAGIAVAAMFIAGAATLPGIFVGSLILNIWVGYSRVHHFGTIEGIAALAIAAASTLQAIIGGRVLRRFIGYPAPLDTPHQLIAYLIAVPAICATSATFSVYSLWLLGIVQSNGVLSNWVDWWIGDSLGVLVAVPLMLMFFGEPRMLWQYRRARVAVPIAAMFAFFVVIFSLFPSFSVIAIGGFGTGLLGAFLLLLTGQSFQLATTDELKGRLAAIVDWSDEAIMGKDLNGTLTSWNKGAERTFGYSEEEAIGKSVKILIPPELHAEEDKIIASICRGELVEPFETKRIRKDGQSLDVSITVSPIRNREQRIVGASTIARDVTGQKEAQRRIAADLQAMTRLHDIGIQCMDATHGIEQCLQLMLDAAMEITRAGKGYIQLLDASSGALTISVQRGFDDRFLTFFGTVHNDSASSCGAALSSHERVVLEDVTQSPIFAGLPALEVMLEAQARACQSTPLVSSKRKVLGMLSTHFERPHRPDERELRLIDLLARQAADYLERKQAELVEIALKGELQHRSNNLLAVVQSITNQTLMESRSISSARDLLRGRLEALARANRQLTKTSHASVDLREIVNLEMEPFADRATIQGATITLGPQQAQSVTLVLHELITNAIKYGALSTPAGKVGLSWSVSGVDGNRVLTLNWREHDGPPVVAPDREGFGTTLLKAIFSDIRLDYAPGGFACEMKISVRGASPPNAINS